MIRRMLPYAALILLTVLAGYVAYQAGFAIGYGAAVE